MSAHVVVALSGGVDSSVTAMLLARDDYRVSAMFMKNWEEDDRLGACPAEEDAKDAAAVCQMLDIKLHTRNFSAEYWDQVFEHFLAEYQAGRTPNPDILCNREIKFKTFLEHANDLGGDLIATGHYARRDQHDGRWRLLRGIDGNKDQSYFLYTLGQTQLASTLFPLGELQKPRVRQLAESSRLPVARKKDSTGICFIGERNFKQFLGQYLPAQPGLMQTVAGQTVGEHDGLMYYTLGQRQGLGIGGTAHSNGQPWYVLDKDLTANRLIVGQGHDHPWLFSTRLDAGDLSWVDGKPPAGEFSCSAKIRYRQADQACRVTVCGDTMAVDFEQPQRAVTPGQSVVLYAGPVCLGGGIIQGMMRPAMAA